MDNVDGSTNGGLFQHEQRKVDMICIRVIATVILTAIVAMCCVKFYYMTNGLQMLGDSGAIDQAMIYIETNVHPWFWPIIICAIVLMILVIIIVHDNPELQEGLARYTIYPDQSVYDRQEQQYLEGVPSLSYQQQPRELTTTQTFKPPMLPISNVGKESTSFPSRCTQQIPSSAVTTEPAHIGGINIGYISGDMSIPRSLTEYYLENRGGYRHFSADVSSSQTGDKPQTEKIVDKTSSIPDKAIATSTVDDIVTDAASTDTIPAIASEITTDTVVDARDIAPASIVADVELSSKVHCDKILSAPQTKEGHVDDKSSASSVVNGKKSVGENVDASGLKIVESEAVDSDEDQCIAKRLRQSSRKIVAITTTCDKDDKPTSSKRKRKVPDDDYTKRITDDVDSTDRYTIHANVTKRRRRGADDTITIDSAVVDCAPDLSSQCIDDKTLRSSVLSVAPKKRVLKRKGSSTKAPSAPLPKRAVKSPRAKRARELEEEEEHSEIQVLVPSPSMIRQRLPDGRIVAAEKGDEIELKKKRTRKAKSDS